MDIKELAKRLNGREYRQEITEDEEKAAEESGVVVVFGYSDDLMEFKGAIYGEVSCYDGGSAYLDEDGLIEHCEEECSHYKKAIKNAKKITAIWCKPKSEFGWEYETDIPHETFTIWDCGDKHCKGIVFYKKDI